MEIRESFKNDLELCEFICERYTVTITANDLETVALIERDADANRRTVCEHMREELLSQLVLGDWSEEH